MFYWLDRLVSGVFVAVITLLLAATTGAVVFIAIAAPLGLASVELSERRVGLGTGCLFVAAFVLIKGTIGAIARARSSWSPATHPPPQSD